MIVLEWWIAYVRLKLSGPLVFRAQIPKAILENPFGKMKYTGFGGAGQFFDFLVIKTDLDPICKVQRRTLPTSMLALKGKYKWVRFKLTLRKPMFLMLMFPELKQILFSSNRNINIGSSNWLVHQLLHLEVNIVATFLAQKTSQRNPRRVELWNLKRRECLLGLKTQRLLLSKATTVGLDPEFRFFLLKVP